MLNFGPALELEISRSSLVYFPFLLLLYRRTLVYLYCKYTFIMYASKFNISQFVTSPLILDSRDDVIQYIKLTSDRVKVCTGTKGACNL